MIKIENFRDWYKLLSIEDQRFIRPIIDKQFTGKVEQNAIELLERVNKFLHNHKASYLVTSGYRPVEWELRRGRPGTSLHTLGKAIDFTVVGNNRLPIMRAIWEDARRNWDGGHAAPKSLTFIHLDTGRRRTWTY